MRILFNSTEITKEVEKLDTTSCSMTYVAGNFIYIASDFPFNHLFIKMGTVKNAIAVTMKIEYWDGSAWVQVVELRDHTNGLFNDGFIEFTPHKQYLWSLEDESDDIPGFTKILYDKYWTRISFNLTLTPSVDISFMGHKFSDDTDLFVEYPVFNDSSYLTAFKAGKTSWEEQAVKAAEMISMDLMKKSVILGPEQILERRKFIGASVCKVAEIIFTAFGNDYIDQKKAAHEEYYRRLDLSQYSVDTNGDAILNSDEVKTKQGWLSR